jgi:hypothetical protein
MRTGLSGWAWSLRLGLRAGSRVNVAAKTGRCARESGVSSDQSVLSLIKSGPQERMRTWARQIKHVEGMVSGFGSRVENNNASMQAWPPAAEQWVTKSSCGTCFVEDRELRLNI